MGNAGCTLPDVARLISGKTYVFEPNPAQLDSIAVEFDGSSEATISAMSNGRPLPPARVDLDGVYRFSLNFVSRGTV